MWTQIARHITQTTEKPFGIEKSHPVSGGCINQGYAISGNGLIYFVKINQANQEAMFAAEALGLKQIHATKTIRVPEPICWGIADKSSYLVLEWLEFGGGNSQSWEKMGRNLARLHQVSLSDRFGWHCNNTIGSTPQINTISNNWADFFAHQRIGYQLRLAKERGGNFPDEDQVIPAISEILSHHQPHPSLVHGDLWSGNAAITVDGEPVILDPATYWGDREVDLAMTELFGGFPAAFYRGYNDVFPLDAGYQQRKTLYNLYHILNHFNLFGGGYASQANRMLQEIL
ncbi:MAG: fructosamine kinase family protein [Microcystis viridis Mv_BB_P_19951000_S69]|uniref:Fructosamine kinase family protein n=1 Tax=Microcystis viridis Mv_BB_P_19951000_S68D TaxID=2486270 RepID=A0A552HC12_MICVR|nr:fructosamine kinase family protein [Microcystis aeruginosa LG13-11]TRU67960.1 MAG: fructosamine kinase family protein [Microcystis viridis Mv_BB_P_19951000_S69]TRU68729.1 MAG: fructosamine kinase family protein [Microcystis viridis Mv_BB_P_19951000_S68D]TRU76526.1 MAG: fructosamine kinase family protein [Microcystis viridis Mv_BB_P_19951000_S68]TRU90146.1 MAG: fructosamine kinase family protein [Microcystis viridis Mv_BB_P_19951000_S69D]